MSKLDGVRVVVTGSTSGLGAAMASALYEAGARVMVTGRNRVRAQIAAASLGATALGCELDVRDPDSVEACISSAVESWDGIDMLVNNAGIGMRTVNPHFMTDPMPFWDVSVDGFRDVIDTKMTGCFLMARAVVPIMLERGHGRIVNVSMNEQTMVRRGFTPYGPAGAGVEALSQIMAADLADTPISVNTLLPGGATQTGMIPDEVPDVVRAKLLDPSIMGAPIVWLASRSADGIRGQRINALEFAESLPNSSD